MDVGDPRIPKLSFDLSNEDCWKAMDVNVLKSIPHQPPVPFIAPRPVPFSDVQVFNDGSFTPLLHHLICPLKALESKLRLRIAEMRWKEMGWSTSWDDGLSYILRPSLHAYEVERMTGVVMPSGDIQVLQSLLL